MRRRCRAAPRLACARLALMGMPFARRAQCGSQALTTRWCTASRPHSCLRYTRRSRNSVSCLPPPLVLQATGYMVHVGRAGVLAGCSDRLTVLGAAAAVARDLWTGQAGDWAVGVAASDAWHASPVRRSRRRRAYRSQGVGHCHADHVHGALRPAATGIDNVRRRRRQRQSEPPPPRRPLFPAPRTQPAARAASLGACVLPARRRCMVCCSMVCCTPFVWQIELEEFSNLMARRILLHDGKVGC